MINIKKSVTGLWFQSLFFLVSVFVSSISIASVNYHGRIISQSNNSPLVSSNVRFNIKIKAGSSCVVYEENHSPIDMSGSNGYFSLNLGDGSPVFGTFDSAMKIDGSSVNCQSSGSVSLTAGVAKSIDVQVLDFDGSSYSTNITQISGIQIKDVPVAIEAKSLEGKGSSAFIQSTSTVTQIALDNIITGASSPYVLSSDLSSNVAALTAGKLNSSSNLSDLGNTTTARTNLGLGSLAVLNSVSDSSVSSLSYSKLTGVPSTFAPSAHSHPISDITNLQTQLNTLQSNIDAKVSSGNLSLNCNASQTIQYISVSDSFQCQSITISSSQVSGLGSLATKSSVSDSDINSLSGSKLTGGVQIGSVSGTSCSSSGLARYNNSILEVCNGSVWAPVSQAVSSSDVTTALGYTPLKPSLNLSDLSSAPTARTNLGLGSLATKSSVGDADITALAYSKLTGAPAIPDVSGKMDKSANLSDVASVATARTNLGLGSLATKSSVSNSDITDLAYSKLTGTPAIPDVSGKMDKSANLSDVASVSTARTNLGLGSLATLSTIGNSQITDLAGSKLTGGVQVGTVAGTTCSSAGLTRYNNSILEVCNGTGWVSVSNAVSSSDITTALGYTPLRPSLNLSDVASVSTARTNLGLGGSAVLNVGTATGTVAAGDDSRITGAAQKSSNLSDLASVATARTNLGLGSLATLSVVSDANITSVAYSKLTSVPSTFTPSAHTHIIGDVTGLQTALDAKLSVAKLSLNCTAAQTIQYNSVPDTYSCQSILIPSTQVSGLGSLATKSAVADADITSLSGSKLTGGVQVSTVSGTSCSLAGLTRYNAGIEYCDGAAWVPLSANNVPAVVAAATGSAPAAAANQPIIFNTKFVDTIGTMYSTSTGKFTIPSDGVYELSASMTNNTGYNLTFYMWKNNALSLTMSALATSEIATTMSGVNTFVAGDTVDLRPNVSYTATGGSITLKKVQPSSALLNKVPKITKYNSGSGTHTITGSPLFVKIEMVGGGGGGGGGQGQGFGGTGGTTSFNSINANGGAGGAPAQGNGNTGIAAGGTGGTGTATVRITGSSGANGTLSNGGGAGGNAAFFGGGAPATFTTSNAAGTGTAGIANTGGGGSGGFSVTNGGGGGGGEYVMFTISNPSGGYSYSVGAAGAAGTGGSSAGGAGGSGVIIVTEYYQ